MIARFSPVKAVGLSVFMLPFIILPWWFLLAGLGSSEQDRQTIIHDWSNWGLILLSPIMLLVIVLFARKLLFEQGRAVWLDGGNLVFMPMFWSGRGLFRSVPLRDIDRFAIDVMGFSLVKGIYIYLKDGTEDAIPSHLLEEPRDVVLTRLNEALAESRS